MTLSDRARNWMLDWLLCRKLVHLCDGCEATNFTWKKRRKKKNVHNHFVSVAISILFFFFDGKGVQTNWNELHVREEEIRKWIDEKRKCIQYHVVRCDKIESEIRNFLPINAQRCILSFGLSRMHVNRNDFGAKRKRWIQFRFCPRCPE